MYIDISATCTFLVVIVDYEACSVHFNLVNILCGDFNAFIVTFLIIF